MTKIPLCMAGASRERFYCIIQLLSHRRSFHGVQFLSVLGYRAGLAQWSSLLSIHEHAGSYYIVGLHGEIVKLARSSLRGDHFPGAGALTKVVSKLIAVRSRLISKWCIAALPSSCPIALTPDFIYCCNFVIMQ